MVDLKKTSLRGLQREAARAQAGIAADTSVLVALADIVVDEAIQVRQTGLDQERVQQYALAMVEYSGWGEFPPLVVFRDPETNVIRLAGSFHRRAAVDLARQGLIEDGKPPIEEAPCEIRTGGYREAVEFAEDDNLQHGLNLTNRDKRAIYVRRMTEGHVWAEYSNRRVAAELGMSEITIRRWYADLSEDDSAPGATFVAPDTRVGQDGKSYPIKPKQRAQQEPTTPRQPSPRYEDDTEPSGAWQDGPPAQPAQPRGTVPSPRPAAPVPQDGPDDDDPLADMLDELADHLIGAANMLSEALDRGAPVSPDALTSVMQVMNYCNGYDVNGHWFGGLLDLVEAVIARGNE